MHDTIKTVNGINSLWPGQLFGLNSKTFNKRQRVLGWLLARQVWKSILKRSAAVLIDVLTYCDITLRKTELKLVSKCARISSKQNLFLKFLAKTCRAPDLIQSIPIDQIVSNGLRSIGRVQERFAGCDKRTRSYARRVSIASQMFSTRRVVYHRMVLRWRVHRYRIRVSCECYSVCPGDSDHDFGADNKAECWTRRAHNKIRTTITTNRV